MAELLCGIDLGTTNSCIAYLKDGKPVPIPTDEGSSIVPSVVSLDETSGEIIVGRRARNRLAAFPEHSIRSVKRLMGKETRINLGSKSFSPQEISAFILKYLVEKASSQLGNQIKRVVITVPAYFNDAQRRATIEAGEIAGLEVMRIINEPTAASLVYEHTDIEGSGNEVVISDSPYILVYDLGGGTFDVSILRLKGEIKEVIASTGDTALGGDDFDERIVLHLLRHMTEKTGHEFHNPDRALHIRLLDIAERAKIHLSNNPYVQLKEIAVTTVGGEPVNIDLEISRQEYEEMINDLLQKTMNHVHDALKEANLEVSDIGKVILVGGATKTPLVQGMLTEFFEKDIQHTIDPDLCVALGASVQSGLIVGEPLGHILLDVTAHSLGIKTADSYDLESMDADFFSPIIKRNTTIPVRKAEVFYTLHDKQNTVKVEVFQGESESCRDNTLIGEFNFALKMAPKNSPVTVEFAYDKEGIVHVSIEQKGYNNKKEVTLYVRQKTVESRETQEADQAVLNYILEKAKRLAKDTHLPETLQQELHELCSDYADALREGEDEDEIDDIEGMLLEKIDEAEEYLKTL